jgi:hypothetical protein
VGETLPPQALPLGIGEMSRHGYPLGGRKNLAYSTPQHRIHRALTLQGHVFHRTLTLQKLPASFVVPTGRLPLAEGRVTFLRRVSMAGTVTVLSQTFRVGKRHRGLYLRLVVDIGRSTGASRACGRRAGWRRPSA